MNYILTTQTEDELYHFGVPGMKWGKRKALPKSDLRKRYDAAKTERNKKYLESQNADRKAINYSDRHFVTQFTQAKRKRESDRLWDESFKKADAYDKAKKDFKQVKKERKEKLKESYKDIKRNSSIVEKVLYNTATRKKAAKYVTDHNMTIADAKKRANSDARRNTAIALGVIGATTIAEIAIRRKILNP